MLDRYSYVTIILTKRCSLSCDYCFEDAGPTGAKDWDVETLRRCLREASQAGYRWVAITGGDPPTHPQFNEVMAVEKHLILHFLLPHLQRDEISELLQAALS